MSKTFCPLPWSHLATHPHGSVTLCCESSHVNRESESHDFPKNFKTLHSENYNLESILNSDYFNQVRRDMLNDKVPEACSKCFYYEEIGKGSKRQREKNKLNFDLANAKEITNKDGSLKTLDFEFIELRLGNYCNLGCRTCNPSSSTRLKKDWKEIFGEKDLLDQQKFEWPDDENFWVSLAKHTQSLKHVYINGGEPLLIDKHRFFLQELIKNGVAKDINLVYSTNGTIINSAFIDVWKEFRSVDIMISVDDIEERNNYIRFPSDWKKIVSFIDWLELLKKQGLPLTFRILQTISAMNVYYIGKVYDYFSARGIAVSRNYVHEPVYYRPDVLPNNIKKLIINKHKSYAFADEIKSILKTENNQFHNFIKITQEFDKIRNQSFKEIFPELSELIDDK